MWHGNMIVNTTAINADVRIYTCSCGMIRTHEVGERFGGCAQFAVRRYSLDFDKAENLHPRPTILSILRTA